MLAEGQKPANWLKQAGIINGNMKFLFGFIFLSLVTCSAFSGFLAWQYSKQASVRLEWTTASEIDTAGFNVYRSENPDGGFTLVNAEIIPAAQDPLIGAAYSYVDNNVAPGTTYYYLLEDVAMNGQVHRNNPIEVTARANYWLNLSISTLSFGLALLLLLNKRCFVHNSLIKKT